MEEMTNGEIIKQLSAENQTRTILAIIESCETLEEAIAKVKALLEA